MTPGKRQIARAAALVIVLFILSRTLGLAREMVIGAVFGTGADYDAYLAAVRIPDILFTLIAGGALGSAFIPTFTAAFARGDPEGGWRLASSVANLLLVALTGAAGLAWLGAPPLVHIVLAPGFGVEQQALTVSLMRVMLAAPLFFGVSGVVMGVLNARQHFLLPALAPSFLNLSLIGAAWLLAPRIGVQALALGYVVGAALHLAVQLPGLVWVGARYRPLLTLRDPGVREVLRLMAPRVLGLAAVQLNFLVNTNLASRLGEGAVSALNYAWLLMLLPQGVFAQAVATAAFPTFAEQVAWGARKEMRVTLAATLRAIFFVTIPAAVGLLVLRRPLVALLFERGAFRAASTEAVAWALAFYALGLVGHAGVEIVARAFYALHDTRTPVWVSGLAMGLNVLLSLTLPTVFVWAGLPPHAGLALANSAATLLEMIGLLALLRPRLGGLAGRALAASVARSGLAAAVMASVLVVWQRAAEGTATLVVGGGGVALGAGVYLAAAVLLGVEELRAVSWLLRSRPRVDHAGHRFEPPRRHERKE
ncbi:MAG TPA: murein biosynthesis integral membrane protein MurJ [Chloroflexi bacterium]|nr:murein biosynthesis integral membrane protein MurJ [Chloroflexota bacterium]